MRDVPRRARGASVVQLAVGHPSVRARSSVGRDVAGAQALLVGVPAARAIPQVVQGLDAVERGRVPGHQARVLHGVPGSLGWDTFGVGYVGRQLSMSNVSRRAGSGVACNWAEGGGALTCRPGSRRRSDVRAKGRRTWRSPRPSSGSARFVARPGWGLRFRASRQIDVGYRDNKQHPTARCTEVRGCDGRFFRARTSSSAGATWSRSTSILREAPLMSYIRLDERK